MHDSEFLIHIGRVRTYRASTTTNRIVSQTQAWEVIDPTRVREIVECPSDRDRILPDGGVL